MLVVQANLAALHCLLTLDLRQRFEGVGGGDGRFHSFSFGVLVLFFYCSLKIEIEDERIYLATRHIRS